MREIPLREYMKGKKQSAVAEAIGITQGGISQILRSGRHVFVRESAKGEVAYVFEIRGIGSYKNLLP